MFRRVMFLNVASSDSPLYVNPVLLQALAGATKRELADVRVDVFDGAAGDSCSRALEYLDKDDVAVICMMTDANLNEFLNIAVTSLSIAVPIVLIGNLVTDAEVRSVLSRVTSVLPNNPMYAFVGREADRFLQLLRVVASHSSVGQLQNVVSLHQIKAEPKWDALPSVTTAPQLLFTETITGAIEERGLAVLMEGLTRGCEYHCTYCHLNFNKQTRGLVQAVAGNATERINDVAYCTPESSFIFFTDENFFGGKGADSKERLEAIIQLSEDLTKSNFARYLAVDTRIDTLYRVAEDQEERRLRRHAWRSFRSAGLRYAYLGVESFSESQLRRYAKSAEYPAIIPGIALARELGLAFTLGMIIMDPLVTPAEIKETLAFVDRLDLYAHIASPLKPLRLGVKSPYAGWAAKKLPAAKWNTFPGSVNTFNDTRIRDIWPVVRRIHTIFSQSGYRHSDVAMFDSVFSRDPAAVKRIPEMVARMECEVLHTLIEDGIIDSALSCTTRIVEETVLSCKNWIANNPPWIPGSVQEKVVRYFEKVFELIHMEVAQSDWLELERDYAR